LLCSALAGCVTKAQAQAQARAAYLAGQQEALMRLQQTQAQGPSVRINGPVRNPVVPWTPGLTLSQAIMAADYQAAGDPTEILVVRNSRASRVNVRSLLSGQDVPLQPGDVVQIVPRVTGPGANAQP
jgi:molybdopterin converting factor small subunit